MWIYVKQMSNSQLILYVNINLSYYKNLEILFHVQMGHWLSWLVMVNMTYLSGVKPCDS